MVVIGFQTSIKIAIILKPKITAPDIFFNFMSCLCGLGAIVFILSMSLLLHFLIVFYLGNAYFQYLGFENTLRGLFRSKEKYWISLLIYVSF
jgi:hypothetical protein